MEGSDETGVMQRIQSSFANCSSSVPKQQLNHQMSINGQMQNLSVDGSNNSNSNSSIRRPAGIPPSHPHYPPSGPHSHQFGVPKMGSQHVGNAQHFTVGPTHSRSLSQPSCFSFDHLPPLSPSTFRESPQSSGSDRVHSDHPMEEKMSNAPGGLVSDRVHFAGDGGLPPRRGHRRSSSDIPLGFTSMVPQFMPPSGRQGGIPDSSNKPVQLKLKQETDSGGSGNAVSEGAGERKPEGEVVDDLFSAYMNLDNIDALNSSSMEDKDMDSRASGTRTNDSSENEVESSIVGNSHGILGATSIDKRDRGKRSATGDIAPIGRHFRSLSMDSFMGNLNFSDESPKLPPSPGFRSAQHSPSNSLDGTTNNFSLEFGNGEFSPAELKKIMASEKLAEIAMADPKRAKRILANRQSAARSKERKLIYIGELEHKVQTLQTEATTLSAQLTLLQRDSAGLTKQNNELRFRLQAMEQQAQLRDALNEALTAEVQCLKLATAELRGEVPPSSLPQQFMANSHMFQMPSSQYMYQLQKQNNQKQQQPPMQTEQSQQNQAAKSQQDADTPKN